jgi:cytochrome c peroxidase
MTATRVLLTSALLLTATLAVTAAKGPDGWSRTEMDDLRSLSIAALEPLGPDPTNRVADDPRAATLGERLFFDTRLSANGMVACATCHLPDRDFQNGRALGRGVGVTEKRTMPIAATSRAPFLFWDGRKDSQWAQALGPLESAVEHGGSRAQYAHSVAEHYRSEYQAVFGPLPDLATIPPHAGPVADPAAAAAWASMPPNERDAVTGVFVNIGKAIAAYERRLDVGPSRFDRYVDALVNRQGTVGTLTTDEIAGLKLFIGKANCTQCHNGPLFTNNEFHNNGVPRRPGLAADDGRLTGASAVMRDEFNCRSRWSDAREPCTELAVLITGEHTLAGAYKVPSLRNVAERAPYMDAGQFATLGEVLDHYNRAPAAPAGHTELKPLRLTPAQLRQLEAFLRALSGPTIVSGRSDRVSSHG